jgi:HEPN domain-containing protein
MARDLFRGISDQEKASKHRMTDAEALFAERRWRGAMYLAGYAVECLLKARLMRMFGCRHLDDLEDELHRRRVLPDRQTDLSNEEKADDFISAVRRMLQWIENNT